MTAPICPNMSEPQPDGDGTFVFIMLVFIPHLQSGFKSNWSGCGNYGPDRRPLRTAFTMPRWAIMPRSGHDERDEGLLQPVV
jgi:hypothetical protein